MSKVLPSDINSLFEKLETIRQEHVSAGGLTSAEIAALGTAYETEPAVSGEKVLKSLLTNLSDNITNLENSPYIDSGFSAKIQIPTVGQLL